MAHIDLNFMSKMCYGPVDAYYELKYQWRVSRFKNLTRQAYKRDTSLVLQGHPLPANYSLSCEVEIGIKILPTNMIPEDNTWERNFARDHIVTNSGLWRPPIIHEIRKTSVIKVSKGEQRGSADPILSWCEEVYKNNERNKPLH